MGLNQDRMPADSTLMLQGLRAGSGVLMAVKGQYVPLLGLVAVRLDRDGIPQTLAIPPYQEEMLVLRRSADEDDGA